MKVLKKSVTTLGVMIALCMLFAFSAKVNADTIRVAKDGKTISFSLTSISGYGYQINLYNADKKQVASQTVGSYASFPVKKNKIYYFKARMVQNPYGESLAASDWTDLKPVSTILSYKIKDGSSRKMKMRGPKVKGVSSYLLYVSKKYSSGYKKVKTMKPGKTYTVSKFKGKKFALYKTYYYKIVPKAGKQKAYGTYAGYFYFNKTYVFR